MAAARLPTLRITDYALRSLAGALTSKRPEQGGALLGVRGAAVITTFLHDVNAPVTPVSYANTPELIAEVNRIERETASHFKGIVHSHPSSLPVPSPQDVREYARSLELNPEIAQYLALIVTLDLEQPLEPHEISCGAARVSCFGVVLGERRSRLNRLRPQVIPVLESIRAAGGSLVGGDPVLMDIEGIPMICAQIEAPGLRDASILFSMDYPAAPPVLIKYDREAVQETIPWNLESPPTERLRLGLEALRPARTGEPEAADAPFRGAGAAPVPPPDTEAPLPVAVESNVTPEIFFARTRGLLSPELRGRRVLLVGAGSVGGYVAEALVRSGVGRLTLVDPDRVDGANLGRAPYLTSDIGKSKVAALTARLMSINPAASVTGLPEAVDEVDPALLRALIQAADLVVAATDDNRAQQRLNHLAYWAGRPAVFIGLYAKAAGGEVIVTFPGSPCWQCSTGNARVDRSPETRRTTDYGTGRLTAEPGLLADIHFVSAAGVKVALSLLHRESDDSAAAAFLDQPRARSQTVIIFGMVPQFDFFPTVFEGTRGQYAFQSVWMSAESQPQCPVCGDPDERSAPTGAGVPTTAQILESLSSAEAGRHGLVRIASGSASTTNDDDAQE